MSKVKTIHTPEEGRGVAQGDPLKSKDLKMSKVKTVPKLCLDVETARVTLSNKTRKTKPKNLQRVTSFCRLRNSMKVKRVCALWTLTSF